mgnify:FL=1
MNYMGFVSATVYLFIAGLVIQAWYRKSLRAKRRDAKFVLGVAFILCTWIVQLLIYYDIIPLPMILSQVLPWVQAQSGRTWLWNSWQFWGAAPNLVISGGAAQLAVILALSYPLWFFLGTWLGRALFGNKTYERGLMWLLGPDKGQARVPRLDNPPEKAQESIDT